MLGSGASYEGTAWEREVRRSATPRRDRGQRLLASRGVMVLDVDINDGRIRSPRSSPHLSLGRRPCPFLRVAMAGRVHGAGMREQRRAVASASCCSSSSAAAGRVEQQGEHELGVGVRRLGRGGTGAGSGRRLPSLGIAERGASASLAELSQYATAATVQLPASWSTG